VLRVFLSIHRSSCHFSSVCLVTMASSPPGALVLDSNPAPITPASPDLHESKSSHSAAHSVGETRLSVIILLVEENKSSC
jgi:hypothetical protein